jgi:hypothetical protein
MGMFIGRHRDDEGESSVAVWSTSCAQDPRFNMSGTAGSLWGCDAEITKAILAKQKELGLTDAELDALTIEAGGSKR